MLVSGGRDSHDNFLDDMYLLRIDTQTWVQVATKHLTLPRAMHKVASTKDTVFIFGGYNSKGFLPSTLQILQLHMDENRYLLS